MSMYSYCMFMYLHRASCHSSATLTEVFPCFFLSCKVNARIKPAKTGYGPHSSKFLFCSMYCFVSFCVLCVCVCKCVLYYCHRVVTPLQLTNISYHTITMGRSAPFRVVSDCTLSEKLFWCTCTCSVNFIQCHTRRMLPSVMLFRVVWYRVTEEGNIQSLRLHTFTSLPMTMQELTWRAKLSSSSVSNSPFGGKHISFDRSVLLDPWNIQNPCYNPFIILFYDDDPARFISAITVFT